MRPQLSHLASLPRRLRVPAESIRSGNLREALEALVKVYEEKNWLDRILMASLVLNVKGPSHAERLISLAINEKDLPSNLRAMAYEAQGTSLVYRNRFGDAVRSFERAVRYAHKSRDIYQLCEAQISLIGAKVDCFGPAAIGTLVAEALKSAQSTGDPHMLALLHYRVAVVEGRRGATDVAKRHLDLGLELLQRTPNPWVECCARLAACSIAYVSSDLTGALEQSECALRLARFCGAAFYESASLCNSAQICVALGLLERASDHLKSAEPSIGEFPFLRFCLYDTQAQLQLASGNLSDCEETLNALSRQIAQTTEDNQSFPQLDSLVTRIRLLQRQKLFDEATEVSKRAVALAAARGERILESTFRILLAGLLFDAGHIDEASRVCAEADRDCRLVLDSLSARAELDHVRGKILNATGSEREAIQTIKRSARLYDLIGDTAARDAALRSIKDTLVINPASSPSNRMQDGLTNAHRIASSGEYLGVLESMAWLATLGGHASMLGNEAFEIISETRVADRCALVTRADSSFGVVRETNWPNVSESHSQEEVVRMPLGTSAGLKYELIVLPRQTLQARTYVSSLAKLIRLALEHEQHRHDRLQSGSVWPTDCYVEEAGGIFSSRCMHDILEQAKKVARTSLTILLTGETGVGKEILAREIHRLSLRAQNVFQTVVCAGMPSGLLESQLFGHKKGSFTSASADFPGTIRGAESGTLFLDEIGEISIEVQIKLLRFLELKEIHPVGDVYPSKVDVRVIAATNADIHRLVEEGKFREDLFHRLDVATFNIPPLRDRREEIPALVEYFLAEYSRQNQIPVLKISDEALEYLVLYSWPGNVRELRNEMERLAGVTTPGTIVTPRDLKPKIISARTAKTAIANRYDITVRTDQLLHEATDQLEREMIRLILNSYPHSLEKAAHALGLTRKGLYHKRQRLGML